eukprot:IDg3437t1
MAFVAACARAPTRSAHGTACTRRPRSAMTSMRMKGVGAAATRRAFLSACAVALSSTAKFARAEQISTVAAMEVLRDARESLEALAAAAELGEYTSLRVALRTGSLGRIRMAGSALAAADTSREAAYRSLVSRRTARCACATRGALGEIAQWLAQMSCGARESPPVHATTRLSALLAIGTGLSCVPQPARHGIPASVHAIACDVAAGAHTAASRVAIELAPAPRANSHRRTSCRPARRSADIAPASPRVASRVPCSVDHALFVLVRARTHVPQNRGCARTWPWRWARTMAISPACGAGNPTRRGAVEGTANFPPRADTEQATVSLHCDCAPPAVHDEDMTTTADAIAGNEVTPMQALMMLADAPAYVQDICTIARAYAKCAHARATFCYSRMRTLWDANNCAHLHKAHPRAVSRGYALQCQLQTCMLLIERADIAGAPRNHAVAIRAAAVHLAALLLVTSTSSHPRATPTRIRLDERATVALHIVSGLSHDVAQAAQAILTAGVRICAPRHGSAYAPDNFVTMPLHPAIRLAPSVALGYTLSSATARDIRAHAMDDATRNAHEENERLRGPREQLRRRVGQKRRLVATLQRRLDADEVAKLNAETDAKLALYAEAQAEVNRVLLDLQRAEASQ